MRVFLLGVLCFAASFMGGSALLARAPYNLPSTVLAQAPHTVPAMHWQLRRDRG
jgi:hypothetical protein